MKDKIELDAVYPHPPERVWRALTDPAALGGWLMPGEFKPLIGFRFRFDRPSGEAVKGKVIEVEEGQLLAYTWDDGETKEPSVVVWTLAHESDGTRVRLEHRYVETPEVTCLQLPTYFNWRYALRHRLPGLLALLAGGMIQPRPPVFYACDTNVPSSGTEARIGFRQEALA